VKLDPWNIFSQSQLRKSHHAWDTIPGFTEAKLLGSGRFRNIEMKVMMWGLASERIDMFTSHDKDQGVGYAS